MCWRCRKQRGRGVSGESTHAMLTDPHWPTDWLDDRLTEHTRDLANQEAGYHLAPRPDPQGIPHTGYAIDLAFRLTRGRRTVTITHKREGHWYCRVCGDSIAYRSRWYVQEWRRQHRLRCTVRLFASLTEDQAREIRDRLDAAALAEEAGGEE